MITRFATVRLKLVKLENNERITPGCFHSLDGGDTLATVKNFQTYELTPADFAKDRTFWRIVDILPQYDADDVNNPALFDRF